MSTATIIKKLRSYQKSSPTGKKRRDYLRQFERTMIYRTTKTENPTTTMSMVDKILKKYKKCSKDTFSDFFHHASKEEKILVFTKVAKEANRDQRELVKKANLKRKEIIQRSKALHRK